MTKINSITNETHFLQARIYLAIMPETEFPHGAEKKAHWL
jgi:hypothetical protein